MRRRCRQYLRGEWQALLRKKQPTAATQDKGQRSGELIDAKVGELQHGHHHPQHLAEQRFTGARRTMIKNYH